MSTSRVSHADRRPGRFLVVGGPTVVFDLADLRFATDPTFDPPTNYGLLQKTDGPAIRPEELGTVDVVLVSHAAHADNLDHAGRRFALHARRLLTNPSAVRDLGWPAEGLRPWQRVQLSNRVAVTAVPAQHGPADGATDADGFVNCEVTGFVITAPDQTVYVSGDNAPLGIVTEIHDRIGWIDHAILFAGRACVTAKFDGRPLSLTAERAAATAQVLGAPHVVVAHQTGWAHFTQGPAETERAFADAGIGHLLDTTPLGRWTR